MKKLKKSLALLLALTMIMSNVAFATDGSIDTTTSDPVVTETPVETPAPEPAVTYDVNFIINQTVGGTITVGDQTTAEAFTKAVNSGDSLEFTVNANEGYEIESVTVNDSTVEASTGTTYNVGNITEAKTVAINFKETVIPEAPQEIIAPQMAHSMMQSLAPTQIVEEPGSYTLQVYFEHEDGTQAATMYSGQYESGQTYDVAVPSLSGYRPMMNDTEITGGNLTGTLTADTNVTVTYVAQNTTYTVNHYIQNLSGTYDLQTETITARVGTTTQASARILSGYTSTAFSQKTVVADETITIDIYYNLEKHYVNFNTNGGSYIPRITAKYGESVSIPVTVPTKTGYTFAGWYNNSGLTGAPVSGSLSITSDVILYAKWNPVMVGYTVVYWTEKVTAGQYDYKETVSKTAPAGSSVSGSGDKSYTYFSYDGAKTDKNVVVSPDGSTVVNVYYSRNIYTFTFDLNNDKAGISINGHNYTGSSYSFQAKLGQDISTLWPTAGNIITTSGGTNQSDRFESWNSSWVTKRFTVTAELITNAQANANQLFTATWKNNLRSVAVHYFLENSDNAGFTEATMYSQNLNISGDLGAKQIEGFTYSYSNNTGNQGGYPTTYNFYYTRDKFNLQFSNGGSIIAAKTELVKFDSSLSTKSFIPDRPAGLPIYYNFMGWYTTPQGYDGSLFSFTNAKMPKNNLILYSKWAAPAYDVSFNTADGTSVGTQRITAGQSAATPAQPTKEGYIFDGWYTSGDYATEYDFAAPVTTNTILYAKWTQIRETTYTIQYKLTDGTNLFPTEIISGIVGDTIYAIAKTDNTYVVDKVKASLLLDFDKTENVITFTYSIPSSIYYKVVYKNASGTVIKEDAPESTNKSQIVVMGSAPEGYVTDVSKITKVLANETTPEGIVNNIVTFSCTPISYKISYSLKGGVVNGTNPTTYTIESPNITILNPTRSGYIFEGWSLDESPNNYNTTVVIPTGSTGSKHLTAHWSARNDLQYTVTYKDTLGNQLLQPKTVYDQTMDTTITETAASIDGFTPDATTKSLTLQLENNTINFVYSRNDQTYKVKYVDEDTNEEIITADSFQAKFGDVITGSDKKIAIPDYVFTSATNLTVGSNNLTNIVTVYYSVDKIGVQDPDESDAIPDKYQIMFSYVAGTVATVTGMLREVVNRAGLTTTGAASPHAAVTVIPTTGNHFVNWTADAQAYADVVAIRAASFTKDMIFTANCHTNYELTITANSANKTYNGQPLTASGYSSTGLQNGDYITNISVTGSRTDAGTGHSSIVGTPIIMDSHGNDVTYKYHISTQAGDLTVAQKAITLTADNNSKVYGATNPILSATAVGVITGDTLDYSVERVAGEDAGTYAINITLGSNPNYAITTAPGTFTIEKKKVGVTIAADDKTKVYGDSDPDLTATVNGLVGNDTLNYTLSREPGETAGTYDIKVTLGSNSNYDLEQVTAGTLTITQKSISLLIDNKSKIYGSTDPGLTATVVGLVGIDTLDYTLSRVSGENVNTYAITADVTANPNYKVNVTDGIFTITKKVVDVVVAADNASKVYGTADPELTATVTGTIDGDELDYTVSRTPGESAGTYPITITLGDNPNYEIGTVSGTFEITKKPITVAANASGKIYGEADTALTATVTGLEDGDTINYNVARTAGENAGTYPISVTLGSNPNYEVATTDAIFTINKKAAVITADAAGKVYGEMDPELTAQVSGIVGSDALDYTVTRTAGENAGTYDITITYTPDSNYDITTTPAKFTILKKIIGVKILAQDTGKTYGETDPELTAAVLGLEAGDSLNYTLSREPGENAGAYAIQVTVGNNMNYDVETTSPAEFTISPKEVTLTANDNGKVYGDIDPILTATPSGLEGSDTLDYTVTRVAGENAGTYDININLGSNLNYNVTTTAGTFTIDKKSVEVSVTADDNSKIYGEADPVLTAQVSGTVGTDTLNYELSREPGETVDVYPIHVILGNNPNYDVTTNDGNFTITKKAVTVTMGDASKTYGEANPDMTPVIDGLAPGDTLDYTINRTPGEAAGEYSVSIIQGSNPNYDITVIDGTLTIDKKAVTLIIDNNFKTYGDADPMFTATAEDLIGSDTLDFTLSRETGEDAGDYNITATLGSNSNYDITVVDGTFTISPKTVDVTIVADNQSKTYGEADPTLTAQVNGLVGEDTLDYTVTRDAGEDAGTYDIHVNLGENPNYIIATTDGTLTIAPKDISITADNNSKTYGEADPTLTAQVSGLVGNDTLDYTVTRVVGENAGTYDIHVNLGENPNYNITTSEGLFTIGKKAVTVTMNDTNKTYGEADPDMTPVIDGLAPGDTLNYTITRTPGEAAGEYIVSIIQGNNPNYDITVMDGKLTIDKKAVTLVIDNNSKTYGDLDPIFIATAANLVGSDILDYTLSRETGEDAGDYNITAALGSNPNYDITVADGTFTISPKTVDVTIVADNQSKTYGEADPTLTAQINGLVGDDTLDYTLTRDAGEDAGTYDIHVNLGENPNYIIATTDGTLTIAPKDISIVADNNSKTYGEADPTLTAQVSGLVGDDTLDYTVTRDAGENAGTYGIHVNLGENPNYQITTTDGSFLINKKSIEVGVKASDKSKIYGEADPELTAEAFGLVGEDTFNFTLERDPGENAGTYPIHVILGENPNYDITTTDGTFTILKKVVGVQVLVQNSSKIYGSTDPVFGAAVTGINDGDTLNYTIKRTAGENAGTYVMSAVIGENANYDVETIGNAIFTILPKAVTLTAVNSSKVAGTADPAFTATAVGLMGQDTLGYTITRGTGETVGFYTMNVVYTANANYAITTVGGVFTILAAPITPVIPGLVPTVPVPTTLPTAVPTTVTVPDTAVPLANIDVPAEDGYQLTEVPDESVPLANTNVDDHKCCILHFLIMLLALVVELFYTRSMKKRQARIFELQEQIKLDKNPNN